MINHQRSNKKGSDSSDTQARAHNLIHSRPKQMFFLTQPVARVTGLLALLSLFTVGCQPRQDADAIWQDYSKRLETVINQPYLGAPLTPIVLPKATVYEADTKTLSILQTLKLNHCALGQLIAERNSALGKVAPPSQRLIYHIRFIQLAPKCIETLDDADLIHTLTLGLEQKQQQALTMFRQMLTRDTSIKKRLFIGYDSLPLNEMHSGRVEFESALSQLNNIKEQIVAHSWHQIEIDNLEQTLAIFHRQPLLNQYLRSLALSVSQLTAINDYLFNHQTLAACRLGHANRQQEILQNLFHKYYLGQTQAYLSQLNQLHYRLSQPMQRLFDGSVYQGYIEHHFSEQRHALPAQLKQQMRRQVQWWQDFRASCDIPPPEPQQTLSH